MEKKAHPMNELMNAAMDKLKVMADANITIGDAVQAGDVTIIPVSKVSFGVAAGGSDFVAGGQKADADNCFGGGSGAGANISPIAFLVVREGNVRLLPVATANETVDRVVDMIPELVDKVTAMVDKKKEGAADSAVI